MPQATQADSNTGGYPKKVTTEINGVFYVLDGCEDSSEERLFSKTGKYVMPPARRTAASERH